MFGIMAVTRSPLPTPAARSACCSRDTSAISSAQLSRRENLSSQRKISTSPEPGAQQVLGEIEPRVGKELRARHVVAVDQVPLTLVPDDAAIIPNEIPEIRAMRDRPGRAVRDMT